VRRLPALCVAAVLLAGCAGTPEGGQAKSKPKPKATGESTAEPISLPGASCKGRGGGNARNIPDFVDIEVESKGRIDRVTFRFRPPAGVNQPPSHYVKFTEQLYTGKEGREAKIAGEFFVHVVFGARGVEISGEEPVEIFTGPTELTPGFGTVQEVDQIGDFESTITWGIGLSRRACFRMEAEADRLVIEFPSA
jgi:hypothetical protein